MINQPFLDELRDGRPKAAGGVILQMLFMDAINALAGEGYAINLGSDFSGPEVDKIRIRDTLQTLASSALEAALDTGGGNARLVSATLTLQALDVLWKKLIAEAEGEALDDLRSERQICFFIAGQMHTQLKFVEQVIDAGANEAGQQAAMLFGPAALGQKGGKVTAEQKRWWHDRGIDRCKAWRQRDPHVAAETMAEWLRGELERAKPKDTLLPKASTIADLIRLWEKGDEPKIPPRVKKGGT